MRWELYDLLCCSDLLVLVIPVAKHQNSTSVGVVKVIALSGDCKRKSISSTSVISHAVIHYT